MIEVEVNGVIHEFPEGTSRDVIKSALRKKYSPQESALPQDQSPADSDQNILDKVGAIGRAGLMQGNLLMGGPLSDEILAVPTTVGTTVIRAARGQMPTLSQIGSDYSQNLQNINNSLKDDRKAAPIATTIAELGGNIVSGAPIAATRAGTFIGNQLRAGNKAARVAKAAGIGSASGAAYGAASAQPDEREAGAKFGAVAGGVAGGAIPAAAMAASGVKNAVVPKIDESLKPLAKRARDFGISLRADQVAPTRARRTVQKISQEIPLSGADAFEDTQRKQWNKALAKTIGEEAEDLGPDTINRFVERSSKGFDNALRGKTVNFTTNDYKKLNNIILEAEETIDPGLAQIVNRNISKILQEVQINKSIPGEKISSIRSELIKKSARAQGGTKEFLNDAIEALDDAAERSGASKELKKLRRNWRNFKTMEPLLENSTDGQINPTQLLSRVKSSKFIKASRSKVGEDDLIDLARIGKQFLPRQGGSDTFQKTAIAGGAGGLGLASLTNPVLALQGAALTGTALGANRGLQSLVSNQRLIDTAIRASQQPASKISANPLASLLAGSQASQIK